MPVTEVGVSNGLSRFGLAAPTLPLLLWPTSEAALRHTLCDQQRHTDLPHAQFALSALLQDSQFALSVLLQDYRRTFCPPPHARPPPYQVFNPLIWGLRNAYRHKLGLWPPARRSLMSYITRPVRLSALIYQLGVMRLSDIVSGMFAAIARSKPACRILANGFAALLAVR